MESLWGPLIFVLFIVVSLLGKLMGKKKENQDAPPVSESPDLEGLPEVVRRMLYGPQAARKATPARPATPPGQEEVEQPKPVTTQSVPPRGTPYQPPVARPAPQAPVPAAGAGMRQPPRPTVSQPFTAEPMGGRPEPRKAAMSHALLSHLQDVRRGIVLSEILGPPMAFR